MATTVQVTAFDTSAFSTGSTFSTASGTVTAGNEIGILLANWYAAFSPTIADNQGNTYTRTTLFLNGASGWYFYTATAGSTGSITFTITAIAGTNQMGGFVGEYSGVDTTTPLDTYSTGLTSNTSNGILTAGSITPSANGAIVIGYFSRGGIVNAYSTAGNITLQSQSPTNQTNAYGDLIQGTAGAIIPELSGLASASYPTRAMAIVLKTKQTTNANFFPFF